MADTLSFEQDQVANEAYVETEGGGRIRLQVCSRPALCMVADDQRAFVVAVGAETGETTVRFADGVGGKQPPSGLKKVTATYRRGAGGTGNVELTGLGLQEPFVVIVLDNLGASARHFSCRTARII